MPQAIVAAAVAVAGAAGAAAVTGAALSVASLATTFFTTLIVGAVGAALQKKPGSADFASRSAGFTSMVRQPLTSGKVLYGQSRLSGPIAFLHTTESNKWLHMVVVLTAHEVESIDTIYFDDEVITLDANDEGTAARVQAHGESYLRVKKHTGADGQTVDTFLLSDASDKWTSNHRLRGNSYLYVRLGWLDGMWPNGIPNVSAVCKGKKLYDTRTTTTAYSVNPALAVYDYLTNTTYGLGVPAAEIDTDSFDTAANVCEESVSLDGGGSEDRYTCNGVVDTKLTPKVILEELLSSMAGTLTYQNGKWFVYAGEYRTPTVTIDESDLRSGISVTTRTSRKDLFNTVKAIYVDPNSDYQPVDMPEVTNATYVTEDNGDTITHDTSYPFTTSDSTAQRLGKIELERVRQQIRVELPLKMTGFQLQVGDTFNLTNSRFGWSSKVFEVEAWSFVLEADENGNMAPGINVTAKETASAVWTWSAEETTVDPAPDTDLPNPFNVTALTGLTLDSQETQLVRGANGRIVTRIKASWDLHSDEFVKEGGKIEVQYKKSSDSTWNPPQTLPGNATFAFITDVDDRETYDVRVRAFNYRGGFSDYTTVSDHVVIGKTSPPPNVTGFSASVNLGSVRFKWKQISILDVYGYEIRYGISGTQWSNAIPLTVAKQGTAESTVAVPPGDWIFLIKAKDYVGLYSNAAALLMTVCSRVL
jgi:hypothetical protein